MGSIWRPDVRVVALAVAALLVACDEEPEPIVEAPRPVDAPTALARLIAIVGDVRVLRAGSADWTTASAGDPLQPGDSVQTLGDARATIRFEEGESAMALGPGTTIRIPERATETPRLTHLSGLLVAHVDTPGSSLDVDLPPGTLHLERAGEGDTSIEARIDVDEAHTEIAMERGTARLDRRAGGALDIAAQRFVTLSPAGEIVTSGWTGRSPAPVEPDPDAVVRVRDEASFRWSEVEGADGYVLRLVAGDGPPREIPSSAAVARVPVEAGPIRWSVRATVGGEPTRWSEERTATIEVDRTAPSLEIRAPTAGQTIGSAELAIEGHTEPGARLDVDGDPVSVAADGSFRATRTVARGIAHVVFRVRDDLGNTRVVSRTVIRE